MLRTSYVRNFGPTRAFGIACLVAAVAWASCAQPASAATAWHFGPLVKTWINDCYTFDVVNGVGEYAGARYDSAAPPQTGDVFYVNVVVNGIDASCAEITFPEIKLPSGVSAAISAQNPIRCFRVDNSALTETPDTADCPQALGAPLLGGNGSIRNANGPSPGTWDTRAPNAWEFQIPLAASTGGLKEISFPTQVISGSITQMLSPSVSLPITASPDPGPTPAPPSPTPVSPAPTPTPVPPGVTRPANTKKPRIRRSGGKLVCLAGTWSNRPTRYGYRWTVAGKAAKGASTRTLSVTRKLRHRMVRCRVTASNAAGSAVATSTPLRVH